MRNVMVAMKTYFERLSSAYSMKSLATECRLLSKNPVRVVADLARQQLAAEQIAQAWCEKQALKWNKVCNTYSASQAVGITESNIPFLVNAMNEVCSGDPMNFNWDSVLSGNNEAFERKADYIESLFYSKFPVKEDIFEAAVAGC